MHGLKVKTVEFLILFIAIPVSFALNYALAMKLVLGLLGLFYVFFVLLRVEKNKFKILQKILNSAKSEKF